jgi:hypothetical protein
MHQITSVVALVIATIALLLVLKLFAASALLYFFPKLLGAAFDAQDEGAWWARGEKLAAELEALGFTRLGVLSEWVSTLKLKHVFNCELVSPGMRCFASVANLARTPVLYFLTACEDGAVVFTATRAAFVTQVSSDFIYGALEGPPAEVLALHRARVQLMVDQGRKVKADFGQQGRVDACRAYYGHPSVRGRMRKAGILVAVQVVAALGVLISYGVSLIRS